MKLFYDPFQITKNFHSEEFSCKNVTKTKVPFALLHNIIYLAVQLQKIRDFLSLDILKINSAYRTKTWNAHVGGASSSNHLTASAADLYQHNLKASELFGAINDLITKKLLPEGELIKYDNFVHYAPNFDIKHYQKVYNAMYPDIERHKFSYDKNMNNEQFKNLQKIRTKYQIKTP
jgi:hypothetical protein